MNPGTFVYHGLGWGYYHSTKGLPFWSVRSEAIEQARREGVRFVVIDLS
jgi:hypothetical protein